MSSQQGSQLFQQVLTRKVGPGSPIAVQGGDYLVFTAIQSIWDHICPRKSLELNQVVCSTGFPLKWTGCYCVAVIIVKLIKLVLKWLLNLRSLFLKQGVFRGSRQQLVAMMPFSLTLAKPGFSNLCLVCSTAHTVACTDLGIRLEHLWHKQCS